MPDNSIIIKADDYRYPTREERKKLYAVEPELRSFGFAYASTLESLLSGRKDAPMAHKKSNLYWWDNCLHNRLGSLWHSYINCLTHYERGIPEKEEDYSDHHYINRIQFDFYAETYYYFYATVKDNLGQILNIYFDLGLTEGEIHFNGGFAGKLPSGDIRKNVKVFLKQTYQTALYRNSFTHRYPPNRRDNRDHLEENNGQLTFYSSTGEYVSPAMFRDNILSSQLALAELLNKLRALLVHPI